MSKKIKFRRIYLTGYGKFMNTDENPTELVARFVSENKDEFPMVYKSDVLVVSQSCVREYWKKRQHELKDFKGAVLFIHMGTDYRTSAFRLEEEAINEQHFPNRTDEDGIEQIHQKIDPSKPLNHCLQTKLCLRDYFDEKNPGGKLWKMKDKFVIAHSISSYLCDYIFYLSLKYTCERNDGSTSLFIHAPNHIKMDHTLSGVTPMSVKEQISNLKILIDQIIC